MEVPRMTLATPTVDANADPVVLKLRSELDTASQGGSLLIVGGIALCVLTAGIVALVIVGLFNLWFGTSGIGFYGWLILGLLACGGVVGWALKKPVALRPGEMAYLQGVPADGVLGENVYDYPLIGPHMLTAGIKLATATPNPAEAIFYDRCALLLRQLAKRGEQMPTAQLLIGEDETPVMLGKVIKYLDKNGWMGASSDQSRVWLSTKGQNEMRKLGIMPDNNVKTK